MEKKTKTMTPWGQADSVTVVAEGVRWATTPSHGGFLLSPKANEKIPAHLRREDRIYEEDCDWALVVAGLPHLFDKDKVTKALETIKQWYWEKFEAHTGQTLLEGQSLSKDKHLFMERNKGRFMGISASTVMGDDDMVAVIATVDGARGRDIPKITVTVPRKQYRERLQGMPFIVPEHLVKEANDA